MRHRRAARYDRRQRLLNLPRTMRQEIVRASVELSGSRVLVARRRLQSWRRADRHRRNHKLSNLPVVRTEIWLDVDELCIDDNTYRFDDISDCYDFVNSA